MTAIRCASTLTLLVLLGGAAPAHAGPGHGTCTTLRDGVLVSSTGDVLGLGFDTWGYNYGAHLFDGTYCDAYRDADWCQPYAGDRLLMKWNDAWISDEDCDGDGLLDRHRGFAGYVGSGAWLTNHQRGTYEQDGRTCHWSLFVKIVAAPADATTDGTSWFAADGTLIGPSIWGQFAIVQEVFYDPCNGAHGPDILSPDHAGLGGW